MPVDPKTYARVVALFAAVDDHGRPYGRNRIAREAGVTSYRVDKIAKAEGHTFDRSMTAAAAEAFATDAKAIRAQLSRQLLDEVKHILERMRAKHVVIGWYEGIASEHWLDLPNAGDLRNYITSIGILIDKHLVLERYGQETGSGDDTLARVQMATEVARMVIAHPDMDIDDIVNQIVNRTTT